MNATRPQTALVMGNGPSIDKLEPAWLDSVYSFGSNHIYKKFDAWGRATDAVVITDMQRIREIGKAYQNYPGQLYVGNERRIVPNSSTLRRILGRDFIPLKQLPKPMVARWGIFNWFNYGPRMQQVIFDKTRYPLTYEKGLNFGYSVITAATQIAAIEGFRRILMTGVDANYPTPKSYFAGAETSINYVNQTFIESPRLWMEPILVGLQICLESAGVELIDCTPGGKLRFITKGNFADCLPQAETSRVV
ncbi:hypothetical protein [Schlesneria paludicola]|uniref:hypothetical protein n=1 Tax=Schlesneria paludicola TaxID=360056 RepID=UPI00029B1B22|nr:hypothetical protein [Schlesneria paludicola]